jgi:hypothetical protein
MVVEVSRVEVGWLGRCLEFARARAHIVHEPITHVIADIDNDNHSFAGRCHLENLRIHFTFSMFLMLLSTDNARPFNLLSNHLFDLIMIVPSENCSLQTRLKCG